jgi:hydrogenase maturation protein HypF
MVEGWTRTLHLRPALLAGGDAAARFPVQCSAGFLEQLDHLPDLLGPPFNFSVRYLHAQQLIRKRLRTFTTSSMGRLFDTVAALLGFTGEISFEGQAAMWLEHLARTCHAAEPLPFPITGLTLDFRPLLAAIAEARLSGKNPADISRSFHLTVAHGVAAGITQLCESESIDLAALSGGVFQNELLMHEIRSTLQNGSIELWTNSSVPPNDGGISLGQAASAALNSHE